MRRKNHLIRAASGAVASAVMAATILTACGATPTPPGASSSTVPVSSGSVSSSSDAPVSSESHSENSASNIPASSNSYTPIDSETTSSSVSSSSATSNSSTASSNSNSKGDNQTGYKKLVIEDSGFYSVWDGVKGHYNYYYFRIRNPNLTKAAKYVPMTISVSDLSGKTLKSERIILPSIASEDITVVSGYIVTDEKAEKVSYQIQEEGAFFVSQDTSKVVRSSELEVSNCQRRKDTIATHFTGTVKNQSSQKVDTVNVELLYQKDGKIFGGGSWYVGPLEPGETKAFDMIVWVEPDDYESYQIVANHR